MHSPGASPIDEIHRPQGAREKLLDAAEYLFAKHGIDGVSLREILAESGQRNNSAIQYHFSDKLGLVKALLADRFNTIEKLRRRQVDRLGDLSPCDEYQLLQALWQPMVDIDEGRGGHWFVRFHLSCQLQSMDTGHPLSDDREAYPVFHQIMGHLRQRFMGVPAEQFHYRMAMAGLMFQSVVCWHDKAATLANLRWSARFSLSETINMAVSALAAPGDGRSNPRP